MKDNGKVDSNLNIARVKRPRSSPPSQRQRHTLLRSVENTNIPKPSQENPSHLLPSIMVCSDGSDDTCKVDVNGGIEDIEVDCSNQENNTTVKDTNHHQVAPFCTKLKTNMVVSAICPAVHQPIIFSGHSGSEVKGDTKGLNHHTTNNCNTDTKNIRIRNDIFSDHYTVEEEIGRGKFAVVKRCRHIASKKKYAAKFLRKRRKGKDCRAEVLKEIQMLEMAISHPRLVDLIEVFETSHELIIVTEYAEGGELFQRIMEEDCFREPEVRRLLRQILEGVLFLHERDIVHLDIKPQNVLLTSTTKGNVKLCDLGFARPITSGEDVRDIIGTPDYVAPEILSYEPIHTSTDMWSIGVLTYVLLTGCSPFAGDDKQETFLNISQVNLEFPEDLFREVSSQAVDFISKLLVQDPRERLTARECLYHPWLEKTPSGSPAGQRRALTPPSPDTAGEEPVRKCRCQLPTPPPSTAKLAIFGQEVETSENSTSCAFSQAVSETLDISESDQVMQRLSFNGHDNSSTTNSSSDEEKQDITAVVFDDIEEASSTDGSTDTRTTTTDDSLRHDPPEVITLDAPTSESYT